jgi:hypothetical protein
MKQAHLDQIFANYMDRFDELNNPDHAEYDKWQTVQVFRGLMDQALAADDADFAAKLNEARKCSRNLIDSYTTPFYGLVQFAEKEPQTVRAMFRDLFSAEADPGVRVEEFLNRSHALRDLYYPKSYLYTDTVHSVTGYLFLYDPDHNYIFKASNARDFADCVEFGQEWGTGDTVDLAVYYAMCDQLVEAIGQNQALLAKDASRFHNDWGVDPASLYPDPQKHVLACDLIYDCSAYGLFDGIHFTKTTTKEREKRQARQQEAETCYREMKKARQTLEEYDRAAQAAREAFGPGTAVIHKVFGPGLVRSNEGPDLVVDFEEAGTKTLKTCYAAAHGLLAPQDALAAASLAAYGPVLVHKRADLAETLEKAEKRLLPYREILN